MGHTALRCLLSVLIAVGSTSLAAATETPVRIFTQSVSTCRPDGREAPVLIIDPDNIAGLTSSTFDLGRGRRLCVRTNLPETRLDGIDEIAARVARCFAYLEETTGRGIEGGVLLYVLGFATPPVAYTFRAELSPHDTWNQVRLVLIGDGETLWGRGASAQLREMLLDTLPHELGHHLIDARPTVRQDRGEGPPAGTRWFVDGVCESLAKGFAAREDPDAARHLLAQRHVDRVMEEPALRSRLLSWQAHTDLTWGQESDAYGGALLLVRVWEESRPLSTLLAELADDGGDHVGGDLLGRLCRDTGLSVLEAMDRAAELGNLLLAPVPPEITRLSPGSPTKTGGPPQGGPPVWDKGRGVAPTGSSF